MRSKRHPTLIFGRRRLRMDLLVVTPTGQVGVLAAHTYIEGPFDLGGEYIGVLFGGIAYRCHVDEFVESAGLVPIA